MAGNTAGLMGAGGLVHLDLVRRFSVGIWSSSGLFLVDTTNVQTAAIVEIMALVMSVGFFAAVSELQKTWPPSCRLFWPDVALDVFYRPCATGDPSTRGFLARSM
jgi:hypothetical protein